MTQQHVNREEPYPGPDPIRTGQLLFGRDREVRMLTNLLVAKRIVLLHAPSGAGKSSLVNAGLIPELNKKRLHVFPVIRVNEAAGRSGTNRYAWSTLRSLEMGRLEEVRLPDQELADLNLTDYLDRRADERCRDEATLLIFDQFEELLTVDPFDTGSKQAFLEGVGQALQDRRRWALFVARDDYVGSLSAYFQYIPTHLSVDMPLELLRLDAAIEAIERPRRESHKDTAITNTFTPGAARMLATSLAQMLVRGQDGRWRPQTGEYIEPLHLSIVCRELWNKRPDGVTQIDEAMIEAAIGSGRSPRESSGDGGEGTVHSTVDRVLADYYAEHVAAIAAGAGLPERAIREWFDRHLITAQGIRGQVLQEVKRSQGLDNRAIEQLVDAYLVRREERRGATWYELAHDRLIEPLRRDNEAWYRAQEGTGITVRIHDWDRRTQTHRAEATLDDGRFFYGGELHLDEEALWSVEHDSQAYGTLLFDTLFGGPLRPAYEAAIQRSAEETRGRLRFRLWIDSESLDMHVLPWERLYHEEQGHPVPMSTSHIVSFSRYKGLPSAEPGPVSKRPVRVLVAISNPSDLMAFGLEPIDVEQKLRQCDAALGALQEEGFLQLTLMPGTSGFPEGLQTELVEKGHNIQPGATQLHEVLRLLSDHHTFHFHGHGGLNREGEGFLFFEGSDGQVKIATEDELMPRLAAIPLPRLVVLEEKMVVLAPKLIRVGVPAVITFHEQMTTSATRELMEDFYRQLCERGTVDEALNHARAGLKSSHSEEWAHPVLFTSLERTEILSTRLAPGDGRGTRREEYRELVVRIRPKDEGQDLYPVEATLDDGGVFYGGGLSLGDLALSSSMSELGPIQAQLYRWIEDSPQEAGLMLFEALFSGPSRRAYEKGIDRADTQTQGRLRFRLWIDDNAAELHTLPWEVLYGVRGLQPVPLAASPLTPFSRYAALEVAELEPIATYPLHLLIAISSPTDLRGLDPEQLVTYLLPTFEAAYQKGLLRVTLMPGSIGFSPEYSSRLAADGYEILDSGTTLEALRELLPTCHIFQFFGPSKKDPDHGTEKLVFEDWEGRSHEAPEADLEDLWPSDARSLLRLVVLSTSHATVSLATRLARRLGAAVVASQGPMPVADLLPFAHKFYMHLFEHGLVDRAINEARLAIFEKDRPYWTFPVLLMGLPHGQLFHPPSPGEENES